MTLSGRPLTSVMLSTLFVAGCTGESGAPGPESSASADEVSRWEERADRVTIIRDDWGIAHVYGQSDADAVFGMIYAQAEDDFNRIEVNFLNSQGRLAEAEGGRRGLARPSDEALQPA